MEDVNDVNSSNFTEAELLWIEDWLGGKELRTGRQEKYFRDKHMVAAEDKVVESKR